MVEFFFQLSRLQKLYKIENIPKFQLPKWGRLLVSFHRRLIPAAQIQWCDVLDSGSDRKWVLFNQLLGFLTVLLKISKKITQNNCILMAAKWIICHKLNGWSFLTFCQMSSNCSTPSATFFRHRSISPGGEERSRTTERIREKRERHY